MGEQVQPAALHGLGLSWLVSSNLRSGLQRLVQFQRVLSTNLDLQLDEGDDSYILSGKPRITSYTYEVASIDVYFALVVKMCRITFGAGFNPARVQLRHDLPACHKRYRDFFAAPVEFNADRYAIIFMKSTLEQYLPTANPMLARINDQVVYRYLADLDQQDIIINVRTKLIEALPAGRPTLNLIAKSLNISQRSLQRRLRDEGTGFREQVIAVRKPLAEQYLKEGGRAISEIAFLLGFTEPANFARAFREWTGYTPNEFRSVAKR